MSRVLRSRQDRIKSGIYNLLTLIQAACEHQHSYRKDSEHFFNVRNYSCIMKPLHIADGFKSGDESDAVLS